jgi:hypothetical protein
LWSIGRIEHSMAMNFESADSSIVRSIRQRDLLNAWSRLSRRERTMPLLHQYQPESLDEEMSDLMYYEVRRGAGDVRFMILHGGANLVSAFGTGKSEGRAGEIHRPLSASGDRDAPARLHRVDGDGRRRRAGQL